MPRMSQSTFDFSAGATPSFSNFLSHGNEQIVRHLLAGDFTQSSSTLIWGPVGTGKTHLVAAFSTSRVRNRFVVGRSSLGNFEPLPDNQPNAVLVIDDVHRLSAEGQTWLFNVYNSFYTPGEEWFKAIIVTCGTLPKDAGIREDLATRMTSGLVFHLESLTDEQKHIALKQHAQVRQFQLGDDVVSYLLTHYQRDMPALMRMFDMLDRESLASKRRITVLLVKEMMQRLGL
jgi:DnaA-homolog protein